MCLTDMWCIVAAIAAYVIYLRVFDLPSSTDQTVTACSFLCLFFLAKLADEKRCVLPARAVLQQLRGCDQFLYIGCTEDISYKRAGFLDEQH